MLGASWPTGVDDPAPHRGAVMVLLGEQLIGVRGAFLECFLAVALEHQAGCAPDVDLQYDGKSKLIACRSVIQAGGGGSVSDLFLRNR